MQVKRPARRNNAPFLVCGCMAFAGVMVVVVGIIVVLVVIPLLPGMALQSAGFIPKGQTESLFANVPEPTPIPLENASAPVDAVINLGTLGSQPLPPQTSDYTLAVGNTVGAPAASLSFTETGLMNLCYQHADVCQTTTEQYRNVRLDLRPNGMILYADVYLKDFSLWQPAGIIMQLNADQRHLDVVGVDVNGTIYGLPPAGLGETVAQIAQQANNLLERISLDASGRRYALDQIQITETAVTLWMH